MNDVSVEINGKTFILNFGMGVFILLGERWGFEDINDVIAKIGTLESDKKLTLPKIKLFNELLVVFIENHPDNSEKVSIEYLNSMPIPDYIKLMETVLKALAKNIVSNSGTRGK